MLGFEVELDNATSTTDEKKDENEGGSEKFGGGKIFPVVIFLWGTKKILYTVNFKYSNAYTLLRL